VPCQDFQTPESNKIVNSDFGFSRRAWVTVQYVRTYVLLMVMALVERFVDGLMAVLDTVRTVRILGVALSPVLTENQRTRFQDRLPSVLGAYCIADLAS
jgi:hypothetical protein